MKNFSFISLILLIAVALTACNRVEPNHEGVLMENYGRDGINSFKQVTGSQGFLGPGTELYEVPAFEQKADCDNIKVVANDGGAFEIDPTYSYKLLRGEGRYVLFENKHLNNFGSELLDEVEKASLNPIVLNAYRDEARKFTSDSLLRHQAKYEQNVELALTTKFKVKHFELISLTGNCKPPQSLIKAIEETQLVAQKTAQAKQRLEAAQAELQVARLEAEKAKIEAVGLTREILTKQWIEAIRWSNNRIIITDGKTPVMLQ